MAGVERLKKDYPWVQTPVIIGAPMRLIALAPLAVEISKAGGIGFMAAGTDTTTLSTELSTASKLLQGTSLSTTPALPLGIGFINWGADLSSALSAIQHYRPAAVWFFAPSSTSSLVEWTEETRKVSPQTKVWVQVGSVKDAVEVVSNVRPDVLVVQGTDAGGHGLGKGAGVVTLVPEVCDRLLEVVKEDGIEMPVIVAAGGIAEGRGVAAALALGASGVVLGTRLLASHEANIAKGYRDEVVRASDGGQTTVRSKVYDELRGTVGWSEGYNARGVINRSYVDAMGGMKDEENKRLYEEEMEKGDAGWGVEGRMTTYAGTAVGLVNEVKGAGEIVKEVREGAVKVLGGLKAGVSDSKL